MMVNNFTITRMNEKHIKQVAELEKICFSEPWSEKSLSEALKNDISHFFVAENNDEVLGYIGIYNICGEGSITEFAVFPKYRRKGVGSAIIKYAIDNCKNFNMDFLTLEVRESNGNAISLYSKIGFENVGVRKFFYSNPTENAVIMTIYFK